MSDAGAQPATPALEIVEVGAQALVQDLGRDGFAGVGVTRSGAADREALRLANRLVANAENSAGIEILLGGLTLTALQPVTVALTGAVAAVTVDGRGAGVGAPVRVQAGARVSIGVPETGLRTYLAVRGGISVGEVLGSRATDTLAELGPAPLRAGDRLPVGPPPPAQPVIDLAPVTALPSGEVVLQAVPGPRDDWLDGGLAALAAAQWTVSDRGDRVGLRLSGAPLSRSEAYEGVEAPTEGMLRGAVQVPPGGEPVLMLADHPVTGGYPVVAVVVDADCDRAAQLRPGQRVRLRLLPRPRW